MIFPSIVTLKGGLGNQLFQYAFGKWLEKEHNHSVFFDTRGLSNAISPRQFELHFFRLFEFDQGKFISQNKDLLKVFPKIATSYYTRTGKIINEQNFQIESPKRALYADFWQKSLFVNSIIDQSNLFRFRNEKIKEWPELISKDVESVGIHIRGTDYLNHPRLINLSKSYFETAINRLKQHLSTPQFYVFTDDLKHAKEVLQNLPYTLVASSSGIQDFYQLSNCKHQIISNSTFSWWAAMINSHPNKLVVSPRNWFKGEDHQLRNKHWINID